MDSASSGAIRKPFIEHIRELQIRLSLIGVVIAIFAGAAFTIHQNLLQIIQAPLHQTLYFTSPTGGLSFIFQLCVTVGLVCSFPFIIYQIYQFLGPLMKKPKRTVVFGYIIASFILACLGILFAYYISLPAALRFLVQFGGEGIESLIKADEYFSFALAYIGGFAILFQIPLLALLINRVTPLNPSGMMKAQRWIILGSFIVAAILTPTPDPVNQTLMAAPAIVLYQVSIVMIFFVNKRRSRRNRKMSEPVFIMPTAIRSPVTSPRKPIQPPLPAATIRPRRLVNDVVVQKRPNRALMPPRQSLPPLYSKHTQSRFSENRNVIMPIRQSIDGIIS